MTRSLVRLLAVVGLLVAALAVLLATDEPALAVSLYALVPVLLAVFWFGLTGGLLAAIAASSAVVLDELLTPGVQLSGTDLGLATVNRAVVFFGMALLVALLLRRERALAAHVAAQREELAELESLRAVLTPVDVPVRPGLEFATAFTPADGAVAGDFFLVVEAPSDSTTVLVGDVVGHGLEAARSAAFVRAAAATFARFTSDPAQLLQFANSALLERDDGVCFVTAVCANVGAAGRGVVRWASAGHELPWELDTGEPLSGGRVGQPLGVDADASTIESSTLTLQDGAGLLLFSDGLTEGRSVRRRRDRGPELFGEDRARAVVVAHRDAPPAVVVGALVTAVSEFVEGPLADDLCLVALRIRELAPGRDLETEPAARHELLSVG